MNPAQAIAAAFSGAGITKQVQQAAIVGEHENAWSLYIRGKRIAREDKVISWLDAAIRKGWALRVTGVPGTAWTVTAQPS